MERPLEQNKEGEDMGHKEENRYIRRGEHGTA